MTTSQTTNSQLYQKHAKIILTWKFVNKMGKQTDCSWKNRDTKETELSVCDFSSL